jgi:tetratricopeptide (TPR) repeat protein
MASMDSAVAQAEVLKSEGNTHFKQQQYELAVRAYSTALERLSGAADTEEEQQVAAAVRLNRAWAMLEAGNSDEKWLRTAESDCSEVLAMDAGCVKALYRRALARERLGAYAVSELGHDGTHERSLTMSSWSLAGSDGGRTAHEGA